MFIGDFIVGTTFDFKFTTRRFTTGAPHTLAGTPALSCYEDSSTTEITAGITLTADFDSRTGLNHVTIVATGGNGYEAGKSYDVVITTGTVDSVSVVGEVVGHFNIERASMADAAITAAKIATGAIDADAIADNAIDAGAIAADAITAAKIATGAIDADSIAADAITAAKIATGAIDADAIADGAIDAGAIAADAITAAKIADGAIDAGTFAAGAITASAIAADAIGASELAADAVAEIADAVWDEDATGHQTQGTFGQAIGDPGADTDTIWALANTNLDTTVGSRASQASLDTVDNFLDTEVAAILAAVDTEVAAILALLDDARTEPAQGAPPVNPDMATKIDYLYKAWRNKKDNDGSVTQLYADDGATVDHKQTTTEAAGTVTASEWATGA